MARRRAVAMALVSIVAAAVFGHAPARAAGQQGPRPHFTSESAQVRLNIAVLDQHGRPVLGLEPSDFVILDEGDQRTASFVFRPDETPVDVAIVLDVSGSMYDSLDDLRSAASLFSGALGADDCLLFLPFAESVADATWVGPGTPMAPVRGVGRREDTVLYDAILTAQVQLAARRAEAVARRIGLPPTSSGTTCARVASSAEGARQLLVVVSDGLDSASRTSWAAVMTGALENHVPVLAVYAGEGPRRSARAGSQITWEQLTMDRMRAIAVGSGGLFQELGRRTSPELFERVLSIMRATYVVTFVPARVRESDGSPWREVRVQVKDRPASTVLAPEGYYTEGPEAELSRLNTAVAARLLAAGNVERAAGQLEEALRLDPAAWRPRRQLARVRELQNELEAAFEEAHRATRLRAGIGHDVAARLAFDLGRYQAALDHAVRAAQAGAPMNEMIAKLIDELPAVDPDAVYRRVEAPRVFLAPTLASHTEGFLQSRAVDAELARQVSDQPFVGLVTRRELADYIAWFDLRVADRGPLEGRLRVNRPDHLTRPSQRLTTSSRLVDTPLSRLRRRTIKSWELRIPRLAAEADLRAAVSPAIQEMADWLEDR